MSLLVGLITIVWLREQPPKDAFTSLPAPNFAQSGEDPSPAASSKAAFTREADVTPVTAKRVQIPGARPTQLYIPNSDRDLVISTEVDPMDGCRKVIDPPRDGRNFAGVFSCSDYAAPGTNSPAMSVLAGHSAKSIPTMFNRLYVQGKSLTGQKVYLKTAESGKKWLVYMIEHVYITPQTDLPYMTQVWGDPGASTAGRLVLVTCHQQPDVTPAVQNYVAVAQFVGVK